MSLYLCIFFHQIKSSNSKHSTEEKSKHSTEEKSKHSTEANRPDDLRGQPISEASNVRDPEASSYSIRKSPVETVLEANRPDEPECANFMRTETINEYDGSKRDTDKCFLQLYELNGNMRFHPELYSRCKEVCKFYANRNNKGKRWQQESYS
jgi:hypothetical protein